MVSYESGLSILDEKLNFISHINKKMGYSNFVTVVFADTDIVYIGARKGIAQWYNNKIVKTFKAEEGFSGILHD